jgi:hypothetical protein
MSLGYILGKASARALKTNPNVPLLLVLSIFPDVDILSEHVTILHDILPHRGPIHSVFLMLIFFIPIFAVYRKRALPYFIALVSHPLIGDYLTGGNLQLFWPLTSQTFGTATSITSPQNIALELMVFFSAFALLFVSRDLHVLFRPRLSNLLLAIPTFTVLLPIFLSYPLQVPAALVLPHLIYIVVFIAAIAISAVGMLKQLGNKSQRSITEEKTGPPKQAAGVGCREQGIGLKVDCL